MKIIVFSDVHNDTWALQELVEKHLLDTDIFIFLGDGESDFESVKEIYPHKRFEAVCGNCDLQSSLAGIGFITVNGKNIYFSHGHIHSVKLGNKAFLDAAREANADIALYGHTHQALIDYKDGLNIMNPGSLNNRHYNKGTYGVIEIDDKGDVLMNIVELD